MCCLLFDDSFNERSISTAQLSDGTTEFVINISAIHSPEETFESLKTIFEDEQILDVHNLLFIFQQLYGLLLMKHIQWKNITCHDKSSRKTANYTALSYFSDDEKKQEADDEAPTITLGLTANERHEVENAFALKTMWRPTRGALSDRLDSNCSADTRESEHATNDISAAITQTTLKLLLKDYFKDNPLLTSNFDSVAINVPCDIPLIDIPKHLNMKPFLSTSDNKTELYELQSAIPSPPQTKIIYKKAGEELSFEQATKKYDDLQLRRKMEEREARGVPVKRKGRLQSTTRRRKRRQQQSQ
ncbi:unnamed protein product [Didymodactylos carnosus]|uniref:Uncharacterized protein n=2 Tax=Didymodactylos carnosus TaxID=1234261 RepID=A0A8S2N1E9_9BILA|nr:unnamed protein product [Didymodactylos carnosus]CAF3980943.1 unnamed protein product [Didymodactylos carnosus]